MKVTFQVKGLAELDKALAELPTAYARNILRKAFRTASEPLLDDVRAHAPVDTGHLKESIGIERLDGEGRTETKMQIGLFGTYYGHFLEFGTPHIVPRPFVRPAIDRHGKGLIERFRKEVAASIERARARIAARAARSR